MPGFSGEAGRQSVDVRAVQEGGGGDGSLVTQKTAVALPREAGAVGGPGALEGAVVEGPDAVGGTEWDALAAMVEGVLPGLCQDCSEERQQGFQGGEPHLEAD